MSTSVASVTKFFPSAQNGFTTTLASTIASGAATVPLNSVAGYNNGETAVFVIDPSSSAAKQTFTGVIDTAGVQVTGVIWTAGTNQTHTGGATVVDYATATHISMITKGLLVAHNQDGTHATNMAVTTPKITTGLKDTNGNTEIAFTATTTAVNNLLVVNAASGNDPQLSASGSGTNINVNIRGKGTGHPTVGAGAINIFPYDYVASGGVITADNVGVNKNYSFTSGVVVIGGNPLTLASVAAQTVGASKDRYIDLTDNGDGTALVTNTEVNNNAASPALAAGGLRLGIVVAGATTIAATGSLNQGQETIVLPIASSIPYAVTDSLGNLICPRDPNRKILGLRRIITNFAPGTTAETLVTGLNCPVIIPTGRKVTVTFYNYAITGGAGVVTVSIYEGVFGSGGTKLQSINTNTTNGLANGFDTYTPTSTSLTYTASLGSTSGNPTLNGGSQQPIILKVELA